VSLLVVHSGSGVYRCLHSDSGVYRCLHSDEYQAVDFKTDVCIFDVLQGEREDKRARREVESSAEASTV